MTIAVIAKKIGMTTVFDDKGQAHAVTLLSHADDQHVVSHKTAEVDGYTAVQLSAGPKKKKPTKPLSQHYAKASVEPKRKLYECRVEDLSQYDLGSELTLETMSEWTHVDAVAYSKGKGFAGVMKAHNFAGQRATHGVSLAHRKPGSSGQCQDPGRVFPGKKMARRLGNERKTIQSLRVMEIDHENKLVIVKGAIPGPKGGYVLLKEALKKNRSQS
ncbi:50S ribosomal protein L3 [Candidatus Synchoanobacter obligatus]|uniref:Large ribosomal subunit protein uL3 n=1 Tax=Candidatus Synchoanobacter obligatus TaxID=2919597 RepID=A0ABT1L6G4_9GAMM|nr:50S ribosomal protein L3 [Candidatus Synchoanobacter obligatus]MCP8352486.1 50S ribosomal protein L3 [Candidatus Synchoanobacter obligatus]